MPFGLFMDLWECHRQYNGISKPKQNLTIDELSSMESEFKENLQIYSQNVLLLSAHSCIIRAQMNTIRPKGVFDMAKSANLYVRIEPDLKEQAENILTALGIPASNAITMFYKQIILQNGLPFEVKLPEHPLDVSRMTAAQLDAELEKGYADAKAGRTIPMEQAFANVRKEFGV